MTKLAANRILNIMIILLFLMSIIAAMFSVEISKLKRENTKTKDTLQSRIDSQSKLIQQMSSKLSDYVDMEIEYAEYKEKSEMIAALDPIKDIFSPDEIITIIDEIPHGTLFESDFLIMAGYGDSVTEHGRYRNHKGIDIIPTGDDWYITPLDAGESTSVAYDSIYGKCIIIQHSERVRSFYAHGEKIYYVANIGEQVTSETIIMQMGNTGSTYSNGDGRGCHLHFEIQVFDGEDWVSINPLPFLDRGE